ncbi:MAG: U32 family peptidase [Lachnospiraceae bacterium]|nr:U32 family peptidase [Lachnospiraceae bacterium]
MRKKAELLAPAGSYDSFLGAIHAGADAVYLGGDKFGARAYADNFTREEIEKAIRYAHTYNRRVYLTLNTLIKEREFGEIYGYLFPLYQAGLDAVIIQDFGVFQAVGEWFPGLERHISTQMMVTGSLGAAWLKDLGANRIVPARELSLEEIREIKEKVDIEIETFIHGAICYCYSGQCLFSSILGGRSGNRGRCAQPCRLPYQTEKSAKETYPLSLKDMCTVELLPDLISAGIDSFKIEGRMKSPAYAAGVTAVYRKYLDFFYENPQKEYRVEKADMDLLQSLYLRSEVSQGYYDKRNGKEMITLNNPGYNGRDEELTQQLINRYVGGDFRLPVKAEAVLAKNNEALLTLIYQDVSVTVQGARVQEAQKQPLTEENVRKQLGKSGNTAFVIQEMHIELSSQAFLPVKQLNDLRRTACEKLEEALIAKYGLAYADRRCQVEEEATPEQKNFSQTKAICPPVFHVSVLTKEQYQAVIREHGVKRIYIPSELCVETIWLETEEKQMTTGETPDKYMILPAILRNTDAPFLEQIRKTLESSLFSGVLVRCLEELQWLKEISYQGQVVTDANLYLWNRKAAGFLDKVGKEHYLPYELNIHEIKEVVEASGTAAFSATVYGRLPMMVTANCVAKTQGGCLAHKKGENAKLEKESFFSLTDRYQKTFPVYLNCSRCYNVIYNSLPLSLHGDLQKLADIGIGSFRLDFTTEEAGEAARIIRFFHDRLEFGQGNPPYQDYTKAHLKRGVE